MIITGCQRSGTKSAANIFDISHEVQFTPNQDYSNLNKELFRLKPESSWMAAPFISVLKARFKIIHLVRHPLAVINSLIGIEFWNPDFEEIINGTLIKDPHKEHRNFALRHCPRIEEVQGRFPIDLSMHYYIHWNGMVTNSVGEQGVRIRIEDIINAPVLNSRPKAEHRWGDLPTGQLTNQFKELTNEYGYSYV